MKQATIFVFVIILFMAIGTASAKESTADQPQGQKHGYRPLLQTINIKPFAKFETLHLMEVAKHPQNCEQYRAELSKYDWSVEVMLRIAFHESTCNSSAVGDDYPIAGLHAASCGLLQVRTLEGRPNCEALKNAQTNISTAYQIYLEQGYSAWSVCKSKVKCW